MKVYKSEGSVHLHKQRCLVSFWTQWGVMLVQKGVHYLHGTSHHICQCQGMSQRRCFQCYLNFVLLNYSTLQFLILSTWIAAFFWENKWTRNCKMDTPSVFLSCALLHYLLRATWKNVHTKFNFAQHSIHTEVAFHLAAAWCKYTFLKWHIGNNLRSFFTLFLVGLEQFISTSILHSFMAQVAFRRICFYRSYICWSLH